MHTHIALIVAAALTPTVVLAHAALIDAAWGYVASWVNEIIKQDALPKEVNTLIADFVLVVAAFVRAMMQVPKGSTFPTWGAFFTALFFVALPAVANYGFVVKPLIGNRLQNATSVLRKQAA